MKLDNLYVAEFFQAEIKTECASIGFLESVILREDNGRYYDMWETGEYYKENFAGITLLKEYYYRMGLKKWNNQSNKDDVYRKIKQLKRCGFWK